MLGHSSVTFTLDVYSHAVGGLQKAAMKRLGEVLLPEFEESKDVSKMSAEYADSDIASGRIRTDDQRFTNSKPDVTPSLMAKSLKD
jgi:hypothetical protein